MKVDFLKGVWEKMKITKTEPLQQWIYRLIALHDQFVEIGDTVQAKK